MRRGQPTARRWRRSDRGLQQPSSCGRVFPPGQFRRVPGASRSDAGLAGRVVHEEWHREIPEDRDQDMDSVFHTAAPSPDWRTQVVVVTLPMRKGSPENLVRDRRPLAADDSQIMPGGVFARSVDSTRVQGGSSPAYRQLPKARNRERLQITSRTKAVACSEPKSSADEPALESDL